MSANAVLLDILMHDGRKIGEVGMNLADFLTDENENPYSLKKCKYHCDYGDGEYCHYKEHDGCIYNKMQDGQFKGRQYMTKDEAIKEIEEYIADADKAISEDEEYIRGWKSALLVSLGIVVNINETELT